jgi:hypothetical protein
MPCPSETLAIMEEEFDLEPNIYTIIIADITQRGTSPTLLKDGDVLGVTLQRLRRLPVGALLKGHVWTGGKEIMIRYHAVHLSNGRDYPFCAIAVEGEVGVGVEKLLDPAPPGAAFMEDSAVGLQIVDVYP